MTPEEKVVARKRIWQLIFGWAAIFASVILVIPDVTFKVAFGMLFLIFGMTCLFTAMCYTDMLEKSKGERDKDKSKEGK